MTDIKSENVIATDPGTGIESEDCPPKIYKINRDSINKLPWKNGLGATSQLAIYPPSLHSSSMPKNGFMWRFSISDVYDSCSLPVLPGYETTLLLLPENGANYPLVGNMTSPVMLHHNSQVKGNALKPLSIYTFPGEYPTTFRVYASPLKHLSFRYNRKHCKVSFSLESISSNSQDDQDSCGGGAHAVKKIEQNKVESPAACHAGYKDEIEASVTSKLLLAHFTIIYVVNGTINLTVEDQQQDWLLQKGESIVVERKDATAPVGITMSPVVDKLDENLSPGHINEEFENGDGPDGSQNDPEDLYDSQDANVFIIQITFLNNEHSSKSNLNFLETLDNESISPRTSQISGTMARTESIIMYDDQPMWNLPKNYFDSTFKDPAANKSKKVESALIYNPPSSTSRYFNESQVPPPVVKDRLVIEDFPLGNISTAWINMVQNGLSEWIRVPVIVARGKEPGPVVGITAVVHGNELNGVPTIHHVISDINVHTLKGTVVAVPCVNVPGYLRFTREFSDGKDLNRYFPGQEHGTASQIYNFNFFNKIVMKFDYLIDMHTASFGRVNSYYVRSDMNDKTANVMAKLQHPQIILHNSGQDGTLRSAASSRGIKAITVEIGNPQLIQNQFVEWSYLGVMRILSFLDMFNKEIVQDFTPKTILCSKGFWIYTTTGGVLEVYPPVNTIIQKGALIARIKNIFGNVIDEIYCPSTGITIGRSSNPVAMAGDRVLHLGIIKKENDVLAKEAKENY